MIDSFKKIGPNISILDSHDMSIDAIQGDHCFLIGHHVNHLPGLRQTAHLLLAGGFHYFNIFGEQANLWKAVLVQLADPQNTMTIETSKVDNLAFSYTLAMVASLQPHAQNVVLSDDDLFTDYLVQDVQDILHGKSGFSPTDWQKFRSGFEFNYHGKDAIVSVQEGVVVGFLGEEKTFASCDRAFRDKLFDGRSFREIWEEIRDK